MASLVAQTQDMSLSAEFEAPASSPVVLAGHGAKEEGATSPCGVADVAASMEAADAPSVVTKKRKKKKKKKKKAESTANPAETAGEDDGEAAKPLLTGPEAAAAALKAKAKAAAQKKKKQRDPRIVAALAAKAGRGTGSGSRSKVDFPHHSQLR